MTSYFSSELNSVRQISDLRFGVPIILENRNKYELVISIETLTTKTLKKILRYNNNFDLEPYIVITKNRANFLKARSYDNYIAKIKIPTPISIHWIKSVADPSNDLENPMKGPYFSLREGNNDIAKVAINFCKKAQLLPAAFILPIDQKIFFQLKNSGLISQKISKALEKKKFTNNLTLISSARVPISEDLNSKVSVFRDMDSLTEHYAIEIGILNLSEPILTRLHSACFTGDILHSLKCDCGEQLYTTINMMKSERSGVILYLNQEGRGIGLANKMRAYKLQDHGLDTFEANQRLGFNDDERDLLIGSKILKKLGINQIKLLTNNPSKLIAFEKSEIQVTKRIPLLSKETNENKLYLKTKKIKSGHFF